MIALGVVLVPLMVLYFPFLQRLVEDWGENDNYSHGYFIPFISVYMIYSIRENLARLPVTPTILGLVVVMLGLAQLIVGKIGAELFTQRTSLIVVLAGLVLFFRGWRFLRGVSLPLLYLFFMIPLPAIIWYKIAFPMQLFGSYLTEQVVGVVGIPIFREGNVLHLAETTLEVVEACSGLRSLMTMFALSGVLVWFSTLAPWKKWVLFFSAAPIAVFANIVRLTGTAILASKYGPEVAHGFLHDFSGLVIFVVGLSLLMAVYRGLNRKGSSKDTERP